MLQKSLKDVGLMGNAGGGLAGLPTGISSNSSATILGLKILGGKPLPPGNRIGAVIDKVKKGSIADTVGRLLPGKKIIQYRILRKWKYGIGSFGKSV